MLMRWPVIIIKKEKEEREGALAANPQFIKKIEIRRGAAYAVTHYKKRKEEGKLLMRWPVIIIKKEKEEREGALAADPQFI